MTNTLKNLFSCFFSVALVTASSLAFAGDKHDDDDNDDDDRAGLTVCARTANKMFQSCRNEVKEEYFAATAKCINLGDPVARESCFDMAKESRGEDKAGCADQKQARYEVCELLAENRYDPEALLDTANFVEEPDGSNSYFSLEPGHSYVARAGDGFEETIVVTVTDQLRDVLGVNCRLVVDIVLVAGDEGYEALEVTDDYYAQAVNGDIHYCGEVARNYENARLDNLDGSFEAGWNGAKSGILIKYLPAAGDAHRQEYLIGEAEDVIQYLAGAADPTGVGEGEGGDNPAFPCAGECVKTEEFIPPDPSAGEYKYFIAGTGFVLGVALEDGEPTGERDELLCVGDTLGEVLSECDLDDDATKQLLCELSPIAFCD